MLQDLSLSPSRTWVRLFRALFPAMLVLSALAPATFLGAGLTTYDERRVLEVAVLIAGCAVLVLSPEFRRTAADAIARWPRAVVIALILVIALGVASSLASEFPRIALSEVFLVCLLAGFALAVSAAVAVDGRGTFETVFLGMLVSVILCVAIAYAVYLASGHAAGNFVHRRFLGQFQTLTLPLLPVASVYLGRGLRITAVLYAVAAAWWSLAFLAGGRGTIVAVAAAAVLTLLVLGPAALAYLRRQAVMAALGLGLYLAVSHLAAPAPVSLARMTASGRLELWSYAVALIRDHPLLGVGPQQFATWGASYGMPLSRLNGHPHNAVLQIAAEWGLPAALLAAAVAVYAAVVWLRAARATVRRGSPAEDADRAGVVALTAALAAAAAHAMVSGIVVMPLAQFMTAVIAGLALGLAARRAARGEPRSPAPPRRRTHAVALALAAIVTVAAAGLALRVAEDLPTIARGGLPKDRVTPRFWVDAAFLMRDTEKGTPGP